jgi:hypothetical protein
MGGGAGVVFRGWRRDTNCGSVRVVCPVVKDQGGRLLTGIGGDGGTEGWMVLFALRHHSKSRVRSGWLGGLHRLLGLLLLVLSRALLL